MTFTPGTTTRTIAVSIIGDAAGETDETFAVTLSLPTNATLAIASGSGTIETDDDPDVADVSISKTVAGTASAGQTLTYGIVVSNAGPASATSTIVTDSLPTNEMFVSAIPSQGSCSGTTTVICDLGTIASGGSATISLQVMPLTTGPTSNTATVSAAPQTDTNPANNSSTATATIISAAPAPIPTLADWMKILLALAFSLLGVFKIRHE